MYMKCWVYFFFVLLGFSSQMEASLFLGKGKVPTLGSSSQGSSSEEFQKYYLKKEGQKPQLFLFKESEDRYFVNKPCFQKGKACKVLKLVRSGEKVSFEAEKGKSRFVRNPYSRFCTQSGGTNIILEDYYLNESDFCKFKDKSVILSRNLFEALASH